MSGGNCLKLHCGPPGRVYIAQAPTAHKRKAHR